MGLLDDFKNETVKPRHQCGVALLLIKLADDEANDLRTALLDPTITAAAIMRVLDRKGHKLSDGTITRHRRKSCQCHD